MRRGILAVMENRPNYTIEEYVNLEAFSNLKHEFYDGQILAMGGGTPDHSRLAIEVAFQLKTQLVGRPCAVYSSDARVRVIATGLDTYPDLMVGCGEIQTDVEDQLAQVNPTLLVEVTSKSSEKYDRGDKFEHYKQIPSLREYVIISHREHAIEVFRRGDDSAWTLVQRGGPGEQLRLESIGCDLDVDAIYFDPRQTSS